MKKSKKTYADKLSEIAKEFRFSDQVLESDFEIDDRHLLDELSIRPRGLEPKDHSRNYNPIVKNIDDE